MEHYYAAAYAVGAFVLAALIFSGSPPPWPPRKASAFIAILLATMFAGAMVGIGGSA